MVVLGDGFLSEERREDISLPCLGFCRKRTDHDSREDGILTEEKSGNGADTQGFLMNGRQEVMRKSILGGARGV